MESTNSMNSMSRSSPADDDQSPEESSWTMYFEDFSNNNNNNNIDDINENGSFSSDINHQASSLVSDAASSAARRHVFGGSSDKTCKRLSFKKRKTKGASNNLVDDDLEDTASSPAHSPKVCNLVNQFDKNLKQKHAMDRSQEKGSASGQTDETNEEVGFIGRENNGTEPKKRGLCLVPLSMVAQYLG